MILFLFALNFVNMESRLILILFISVILWKGKGKVNVTRNVIYLLIFSSTFYIISVIYHREMMTFYVLPYLVGPATGYLCGYEMMKWNKNNLDLHIKKIIYIIIFGRFTHGALNYVVSHGYENVLRNGNDFWTKSVLAATGQGALMTMMISLLFYAIFILKKNNIIEKYIIIFCIGVSILNNLKSASRTALIVMVLVFICCVFYTLFSSTMSMKKKFIFLIMFVILGMVLTVGYNHNVMNVKSNWETTALYERINTPTDFEEGDENRKEMYLDAIRVGTTHPFGDGTLNTAHNFWLDILKQTGWIPFLSCLLFTIYTLRDVFFIVNRKKTCEQIRYLVLSVNLAILINFAVEPIMKGMPYYFVSFCIIAGAMCCYRKLLEKK